MIVFLFITPWLSFYWYLHDCFFKFISPWLSFLFISPWLSFLVISPMVVFLFIFPWLSFYLYLHDCLFYLYLHGCLFYLYFHGCLFKGFLGLHLHRRKSPSCSTYNSFFCVNTKSARTMKTVTPGVEESQERTRRTSVVKQTSQGVLITDTKAPPTSSARRPGRGGQGLNGRRPAPTSAFLRCNSYGTLGSLASEKEETQPGEMPDLSWLRRGSIMSIGSDQFGGEADEEVEVFIDVSTLGSVFSHHGSSFFLRIGSPT